MLNWRRVVAGTFVVALLGGGTAASAGAAQSPARGHDDPSQVAPDKPDSPVKLTTSKSKPGGVGTASYSAPNLYTINTTTGSWASLRNYHQQFFIGSVADGWLMQSNNSFSYSRFGFFSDRYFCGWLLAANLDPAAGSGSSPCAPSWSLPVAGFTQYINCDTCNGGYAATLQTSVTYRRNIYPWHTGAGVPSGAPTDLTISRPAGYVVHWRYVSENGEWVAISDPDPGLALNWFFVPKSALPNICTAGAHPSAVWGGAYTCGA